MRLNKCFTIYSAENPINIPFDSESGELFIRHLYRFAAEAGINNKVHTVKVVRDALGLSLRGSVKFVEDAIEYDGQI
jgi:hypothetical protein